MSLSMSVTQKSYAACSPGIPCTEYDIYTDTTAGTDAALNGPKTGIPAPYDNVTGATTSACDGNFMNQIYSNAYMQASREVLMSEQLIHKPDSVLEYTCFDQYVLQTGEHAGPIFSESTEWENREICLSTGDDTADASTSPPTCPDGSGENVVGNQSITINVVFPDTTLDTDLQALLSDTLTNYIDNNFSHTFLGEAITIDNDMDNTLPIGGGTYNCSHMSTVWNIAKCIDFGEDDRFRNFADLINADPRSIPQECSPGFSSTDTVITGDDPSKLDNVGAGDVSNVVMDPCPVAGTPVAGVNTNFSNDLIRIANNCDDGANLNAYAVFDVMDMYDDIILGVGSPVGTYIPGTGGSTTGVITCAPPLPTGIPVITYEVSDLTFSGAISTLSRNISAHYEHVCPNPGCYYKPIKIPYVLNTGLPAAGTTGICVPYR